MIVCAREEESRAKAEIRQPASMGVRNTLDDSVQPQSSKVLVIAPGLN